MRPILLQGHVRVPFISSTSLFIASPPHANSRFEVAANPAPLGTILDPDQILAGRRFAFLGS